MDNHAPTPPSSLVLRGVTAADIPIFFEHQLDPEANRAAAFPARDKDAFEAHWTRILTDETAIAMTIVVDGEVVGNIGSFEQGGMPQVGYWLGRRHWGRGIATKALRAFLEHVTTRPLFAYVAKHNIASIRVLEKCGFTVVGDERRGSSAGGDEVEELLLELRHERHDAAP